jgi:hypothetical protein
VQDNRRHALTTAKNTANHINHVVIGRRSAVGTESALIRNGRAGDNTSWLVANDIWCARRVGEATACINADTPEELIGALQELTQQPG